VVTTLPSKPKPPPVRNDLPVSEDENTLKPLNPYSAGQKPELGVPSTKTVSKFHDICQPTAYHKERARSIPIVMATDIKKRFIMPIAFTWGLSA
jgi:hypothetical protein